MSMQKPFIDQLILRSLKYKAIKTIKVKKQRIPSNTLTGYSTGYLDLSPNATIENQTEAHTSPAAPTADNPNESTVAFMLQLLMTVLENIKQNKAEIINAIPNITATNGQPFIM